MTSFKKTIVIYTRYLGGLDGGSIRHLQIVELLRKSGFEVFVNPGISPRFRSQLITSALSAMRIALFGPLPFKRLLFKASTKGGFISLLLVGRYYLAARTSILQQQTRIVLVEDVVFGGQGALIAAKELKVNVIALPHNIDALTGLLFGIPQSCNTLAAEMNALSLADITFTISEGDAWFHRQFGMDSCPLSYYPATERETHLRLLRTMREGRSIEKRFLIAGSAHNPPTKEGMNELLAFIGAQTWSQETIFDVVGTETKSLWNPAMSKQIVFHGALYPEQFMSLASKCAACIAFQKRGTGSLTRVLDMILAGIPVFGNATALRDWQHLEGIYQFSDWDELTLLLNSNLKTPPLPSRPDLQEKRFINSVSQLS